MSNAIEFRAVDILFAPGGRAGLRATRQALEKLDAGASREEILSSLQVTVGVAGASLNVAQGEISVMMGLSGSGKSTLLRAANGLNRVTRGQVLLRDGEAMVDVARADTATLRRLRRRRVAMVFQQFALLPWRSVRDNVGFGLELRGESAAALREAVDARLELVGLSQWADRPVSELSGGMQQRVGLARAFATNADILLMDEPFSALDPLIRTKLQDELLALQERVRKTILFVSHDLDEALRIGDRISILQNGRIVQTGAAQDIVLRPADDYVSEFVQHMNPLHVLTGGMIMLGLDEAARHYALELSPDRTESCRLQGIERPVLHIDPATDMGAPAAALEGHVAAAPDSASLLELIRLHRMTGLPVLLSGQTGICGVCGSTEIIRALAGRAPALPAPPAPVV